MILTEVAKLTFVDRHGVKVIEKDVHVFLREQDNEQSQVIADHSTFEHALGTVIRASGLTNAQSQTLRLFRILRDTCTSYFGVAPYGPVWSGQHGSGPKARVRWN